MSDSFKDHRTSKDEPDDDLKEPYSSEASSSQAIPLGQKEKRQKTVAENDVGLNMFSGVPASPPKFVSLEQIMKAAKGVHDMVLCHEISVNTEFKIEKQELPSNSLASQVKSIVHQAFWDNLKRSLQEDPPCYDQAMSLLREVKEGLLSLLLPQHTRLQNQINEILDLDLLQQQADHGTLDVSQLAQFVLSTMGRLCAPVRDDRIRELTECSDVIELFKGILEVIDLMKLDMANFAIQQFRPHIQQHSIEYERNKFREFLKNQKDLSTSIDGLEYTRIWLKRNLTAKPILEGKKDETFLLTLNKSYLELLKWLDEYIFPETLVIDKNRFLELRDTVTKSTIIGSVLLVTLSTVGAPLQGVLLFKEKLKENLNILLDGVEKLNKSEMTERLTNVAIQVEKEVNESLTSRGYTSLDESKNGELRGQILGIANEDHSVRKLMKTRILDFIEEVISSSTACPIRIPPGLSVLQLELSNLTGQFLRLISHNRAVFSNYYREIIEKLCEDNIL